MNRPEAIASARTKARRNGNLWLVFRMHDGTYWCGDVCESTMKVMLIFAGPRGRCVVCGPEGGCRSLGYDCADGKLRLKYRDKRRLAR